MLWKLVCHFHIGIDMKEAFIWHKKWVDYFFANLNGPKPIAINSPPSIGKLKKCLEEFDALGRILDENEEGLTAYTVLLSYHYWVSIGLMPGAILASYLDLWLKRCVVPSTPRKCLTLKDLHPAILLASERSFGLLLTMICRIHEKLRAVCQHFIGGRRRALEFRYCIHI